MEMENDQNLHLTRRVLENIFSIGTSCVLHQAAVILEDIVSDNS